MDTEGEYILYTWTGKSYKLEIKCAICLIISMKYLPKVRNNTGKEGFKW